MGQLCEGHGVTRLHCSASVRGIYWDAGETACNLAACGDGDAAFSQCSNEQASSLVKSPCDWHAFVCAQINIGLF